jgi:hypothetical protein
MNTTVEWLNSSNLTDELDDLGRNKSATLDSFIAVPITLMLLIVSSNLLVIFLFVRMRLDKKEMNFSDILLISLNTSDLFIGAFGMSWEILNTIDYGFWYLGDAICIISSLFNYSQYICSFLILAHLSVHRLMLLLMPYSTKEKITCAKVIFMALCWLIPYGFFATMLTVLILGEKYNFQMCDADESIFLSLVLPINITFNWLPVLAILVVNLLIFVKLLKNIKKRARLSLVKTQPILAKHKNSKSIRKTSEVKQILAVVATTSNSKSRSKSDKKASTSSARTSHSKLLSRNTNASLCVLVIFLNFIITQPIYLVTWPISYFCFSCLNYDFYRFGYWFEYTFSFWNPIILLVFHQGIKAII